MVDRLHAFGKEQYSTLDNVIFSRRKRQVTKRLPSSSAVIADFGSGYDCRLLLQILKERPQMSGIAVDTEFHSELKNNTKLELVTANLNEPIVGLANASIDIALSLAVLEHLDKPDVFASEMFRILRPGGILLLTTPGPTSRPLLEFLAYKLKVIDEHEIRDHKQYFSSKDLEETFLRAGFLIENIEAKTFIFGMNNILQVTRH
jgi:SAM-dependent methyltransferase